MCAGPADTEVPEKPIAARWFRILKLTAKLAGGVLLGYTAIVIVGLIPVNNGFVEPTEGVEILVTSTAIHADIIVPLSHREIDWRQEFPPQAFAGDTSWATHVAIGWGDRGFYLHTPTWAELKVSTALKAIFLPSDCCLHVQMTQPGYYTDARQVTISDEQYRALVRFIEQTFQRDAENNRLPILGEAYGNDDAFYAAKGSYHALNTCNSWAGRALQSAGVCVPWLAPMPKSPMLYLPVRE